MKTFAGGLPRSLLFVPGDSVRKLQKAFGCGADAVIADLEDAVDASAKDLARDTIEGHMRVRDDDHELMIRVNEVGSQWFEDDLALAERLDVAAIVVPKALPDAVSSIRSSLTLVPIVETAAALRVAYEIARCPNVGALMFGAIDLAAELATERRTDGLEMIYARSRLVAESAAAGILPPIDSAHALVDDLPGMRAECQLSRSLGFRGKVCIHPVQVEVANQTFERDSEVAWAHSVIRAYEDAGREGVGVIRLEGEMVDSATVRRARRLLEVYGASSQGTEV